MTLRLPFAVTTLVSALLMVWLGVSTLSWATNAFTVWTAEDARRISVLSDSSNLSNDLLLSHKEEKRRIIDDQKEFVVLDFIYTRCPTVCNTLGFKFQQLQNQVINRGLDKHVEILSISFDPNHDSPTALARYLALHKADDTVWSALVPVSNSALEELKRRFGVVVINDEFGGFTHNAAIYVIERGELKKIFNDDSIDSVMNYIERKTLAVNITQASR